MLQRFKLKLFDEPNRVTYPVRVPKHSILRCAKVIPDGELGPGIYVIYDCPQLETGDFVDEFIIVQGKEESPPNADYIDILDVIFEDKNEKGELLQGTVLIPIYRVRSGAMLGGIQEENRFKLDNVSSTIAPALSVVKSTRASRGKSLENKKIKPKK